MAPFRIVFDAARSVVVLFAADSRVANRIGTWEFNGTNWVDTTIANNNPTVRSGFRVVYDSTRQQVLLFGQATSTSELSDIWRWNGRRWFRVNSPTPNLSNERFFEVVYDSHRRLHVLFNGAETWHWDRRTWTQMNTSDGLTPGSGPLVYDETTAQTLVIGRKKLWSWNGTTWTDITPSSGSPPTRSRYSVAFNNREGRLVLFGGSNQGSLMTDTWELQSPSQPNIQFSLSLAEDIQRENIDNIQVRAFCSAERSSNTSDHGAYLYGWNTYNGDFELLAENNDSISNRQALLNYSPITSEGSKAKSFLSTQNKMYFQCRSNSSVQGTTNISFNYMEVRVRYSIDAP